MTHRVEFLEVIYSAYEPYAFLFPIFSNKFLTVRRIRLANYYQWPTSVFL